MALTFEWGIALHDLHSERERASTATAESATVAAVARKTARQMGKDYALLPLLSGRRWRRTMKANATANLLRNVWAYVVICCGHFADGAEKFTEAALEGETKPQWYLRQMLGTANFHAGPVMAFMSGNLCYQIEHHLFPDLPSNRYAEISQRVRAVLRDLRSAVHDRHVDPAVPAHPSDDSEVGPAGSVPHRDVRRRAGDVVRAQVPRRRGPASTAGVGGDDGEVVAAGLYSSTKTGIRRSVLVWYSA